MDQISESALVLAAAVHDGARAPREALAPYRSALAGGFKELASSFQVGGRPSPALPRDARLAPIQHDPALATVAAETTSVLAKLHWLGQIWHEPTHRSTEHPPLVHGRAAG